MVNFGIDVIGAARKDNAVLFILLAPLNGALTLGLDIRLDLQKFFPTRMRRARVSEAGISNSCCIIFSSWVLRIFSFVNAMKGLRKRMCSVSISSTLFLMFSA